MILACFSTSSVSYAVAPAWYGVASLIPGLGQVLKGNVIEGLTWFAASAPLMIKGDYRLRIVGQNIWFYNMYDAWRDAGGSPSQKNWVVRDYAQNFNPKHLTDPIALGFIGVAAGARSSARRAAQDEDNDFTKYMVNAEPWKTAMVFTFVGFGEEALFRGFLFPAFSSWLGVYGGAVVSSTIFGFVHQGDSTANWIRSIFGVIFCWQLHRNKYDLGGNTFAHSWYDQILVGPFMAQPPGYKSQGSAWEEFRTRPIGMQISYQF